MNNVLLVRLLGRNIGYTSLCNRIQALWAPKGKFSITDMDNGYYAVRSSCREDYIRALLDGPG